MGTTNLEFLVDEFGDFIVTETGEKIIVEFDLTIENSKAELHIAGTAEYKILLRDHSGALVRHIKGYQSAIIAHNENNTGSFTLIPFETDTSLIELMYLNTSTDYMFEIQRRNLSLGLDWYIETYSYFLFILPSVNIQAKNFN